MAYIGQKPGSNFRDVNAKDSFTGDGSTVAFDLTKSFNQADVNGIEVFVDNVRQEPTAAYTVGQDGSGNFKRVTFTAAPAASASIYVLNPGLTAGVLAVSDGSVTSGKLNADAITGQTELAEAPADADTFLVHDASAGAIKKIQNSNLVGSALITGKTALGTGAASNDLILIYDTSTGALKKVTQTNLLNFPTVTSVSPTNVVSGDGTGNHTFVITGTGFTGATADLLNASGASVSFASQTVDSATQITGVIAKSNLPGSGEPYDIRVTASTGLKSTLDNQINIDQSPVFSTAAGSLGTITNGARGSTTFTILAADPESGGDVVYTLESGSLPAGCSLASQSSGCVLSGFSAVGSNTTSTFTIRAKDAASNTTDREFTITVNAPVQQSFTSSGTFSVPSGVSSVDVLVVGGGGAGGSTHHGAGGGAGGLIYRPGFTVTPGGTVSVTVGNGGTYPSPGSGDTPGTIAAQNGPGQDSVFGTLTAKGGGRGGTNGNTAGAQSGGGSGGGEGQARGGAGPGTQPAQPGESGNYGFGNPGGTTNPSGSWTSGGGGGGAGAVGGSVSQPGPGNHATGLAAGDGGAGKAYTIADGTTSVYYAGGGGGSAPRGPAASSGGQGGGGGGYHVQGQAGTANRGGGGGGSERNHPTGNFYPGGAGGKGIVIVSY